MCIEVPVFRKHGFKIMLVHVYKCLLCNKLLSYFFDNMIVTGTLHKPFATFYFLGKGLKIQCTTYII